MSGQTVPPADGDPQSLRRVRAIDPTEFDRGRAFILPRFLRISCGAARSDGRRRPCGHRTRTARNRPRGRVHPAIGSRRSARCLQRIACRRDDVRHPRRRARVSHARSCWRGRARCTTRTGVRAAGTRRRAGRVAGRRAPGAARDSGERRSRKPLRRPRSRALATRLRGLRPVDAGRGMAGYHRRPRRARSGRREALHHRARRGRAPHRRACPRCGSAAPRCGRNARRGRGPRGRHLQRAGRVAGHRRRTPARARRVCAARPPLRLHAGLRTTRRIRW